MIVAVMRCRMCEGTTFVVSGDAWCCSSCGHQSTAFDAPVAVPVPTPAEMAPFHRGPSPLTHVKAA